MPELVILAACNTGGENGGGAGESLSGLARAFFFAGARSLLVTHWDANDATTTYLTALFLAALRGLDRRPRTNRWRWRHRNGACWPRRSATVRHKRTRMLLGGGGTDRRPWGQRAGGEPGQLRRTRSGRLSTLRNG